MTDFTDRNLTHKKLVVPVKFKLAAVSTWQKGRVPRDIRLIVLHSAECGESVTAAEALAEWSAGQGHPHGASWHFAVDSNSVTQSVELDDIAWHAGAVNGFSIGIEQAGRASQSTADWHDVFSRGLLDQVAQLLAVLTGLYDLPLDHVLCPSDSTARGICTHKDVTEAYKVKNGHWDPGPNYPIEEVLARARAYQLNAVS